MARPLFLIALILLLALVLFQWLTFPEVSRLEENNPSTTAFMERRRRELRRAGKSDQLEYQWVSYNRISPYLRRAVLVSEDSSFYEHEGVDVDGLKAALRRDWEQKRLTHGGSTITQQLAKNLYLSPARNPLRKLKEYFIARSLERRLTKKRILELYLNVMELGERVYGAEAAARHYFGKSAGSLSPREAALLAGALPNPRVMVPSRPNARLRARQRIILSRMRRWGYVAEKQVLAEPRREEAPPPAPEPPVIDTSVPDEPAIETAAPETVPQPQDPPASEPEAPPMEETPPATTTT